MSKDKIIVIYSETSKELTIEITVENDFSDIELRTYECLFRKLTDNITNEKGFSFRFSFEELMITDSTETREIISNLMTHKIKIINERNLQFNFKTVFVGLRYDENQKFIELDIWHNSYQILLEVKRRLDFFSFTIG